MGVAFGGGSCRGLAHCGVIRALLEAGIPIDVVGGTSAGSLVSALYAMEMPLGDLERMFIDVFTLSHWIKDFTLPIMSLLSGKSLEGIMKSIFSSKGQIEDLRLPFFAVSTNMATYSQHIHTHGTLWLALRSSIALPPFLPPVKTDEGILLDGGFVNTVPTEICRDFGAGFVIGVDVSPKLAFGTTLPPNYLSSGSGWKIFWEKLHGGFGYLTIMNIMTELGYLIDYNRKPDQGADLFIAPEGLTAYGTFTTMEEGPDIIRRGYEAGKLALARLKEEQPQVWEKLAINPPIDCGPLLVPEPAKPSQMLINIKRGLGFLLVCLLVRLILPWLPW
eukprot:TRINITY_DN952_c0_g1_i1.p1 TRINITY_DN952_c0_g1~~TRINITY_DN952_c0_g1_i1.p1  ORF type:complete len:333 (+),score=73.01 TRINITY_DN952_c0_g1_i1:130-1128(+)